MTSTTSKGWPYATFGDWRDWIFIGAKSALLVYAAVLLVMAGCAAPQQPTPVKSRIVTVAPPQSESLVAPAPPAPAQAAPEKEPPYYGSTYWDELLTSVYYYPAQGNDVSETHLKFNHREDDLRLCGDQRKSFEPGNRYKLTVTFEPNQPCISNWRIK